MRFSISKTLMGVVTIFFAAQVASAQLIKIPKIPKPKPQPTPTETSQPSSTTTPEAEQPRPATRTTSTAPSGGGPYAVKPEPPANPQFLPETLEVQVETWDYYWKIPNNNHNTSWVPRINFNIFYGGSTKVRYKADYFMPDGSLWFSEPLESPGVFNERSGIYRVTSQSDSTRDRSRSWLAECSA